MKVGKKTQAIDLVARTDRLIVLRDVVDDHINFCLRQSMTLSEFKEYMEAEINDLIRNLRTPN